MQKLCWVTATSGPFQGTIVTPSKEWLNMGFVDILKFVQSVVKRRTYYKPQNPEDYGNSRSKAGFLEIRKVGQK